MRSEKVRSIQLEQARVEAEQRALQEAEEAEEKKGESLALLRKKKKT